MRKSTIVKVNLGIVLMLSGFIFLNSCGTKEIDEAIVGTWKSKKHKITVRIETERMKFKFFSDSTFTSITINEDKSVCGYIGLAEIENGRISTKWLLPSGMTGVAYTIKCNLTGKIFENDPIETKDVQFWIGPQFNESDWELRYTTNGAQFPMASIFFSIQDAK